MAVLSSITATEFFIQNLLSVVRKEYFKEEISSSRLIVRKEDLLVCVLEGSSLYHIEEEQFVLQPGDVIFLPCGCRYHREILTETYKTALVYFRFHKPEEVQLTYRVFPAIPGISQEFIKLSRKWHSGGLCAQSECACLLYGIYMRLIQSDSSAYLPAGKQALFASAAQKIKEHYADDHFSVTALAAQAEMSEVHFRRCFKQIYHVSPQQYLIELRLRRAKELLQYDTTPITEISQVCGFADPCYFSRIFKQKTGYSPSEYRETYGTPQPD